MLHEKIDGMISEAMKNKNHTLLEVLRAIKSEFLLKEKEKNEQIGLTESVENKILLKMASQREDSINQYRKANRNDLVESEMKELEILNEFIPKMPSDEDIIKETEKVIEGFGSDYVLSMKDMKRVMSEVQKTYPMANGKVISTVIKSKL